MRRFFMTALAGLFVLGLSTTAEAKASSDCKVVGSLLSSAPGVAWMLEATGMRELTRLCTFSCRCRMRHHRVCHRTVSVHCHGHRCRPCAFKAESRARHMCSSRGHVKFCNCHKL